MQGPPGYPGKPRDRYSRQLLLPEIGVEGQRRLGRSRVTIVGMGALGSCAAGTLVRAGVGHVVLIDRDLVELHNLQRQVLYSESDLERPKATSAVEILKGINSSVEVEGHAADLNPSNAEGLLAGSDMVIDGTDNLPTRFLVNDVCVKHRIPWVYAGAVGTTGMVMPIIPGRTPCLRCLIRNLPGSGVLQTCDTAGILNTVPALVASIECTLTYQILTGAFEPGDGTSPLILVDGWRHTVDRMAVERRTDCPCCVEGRTDFLDAVSREVITALCGRDAIQILPAVRMEIPLGELAGRLSRLGEVRSHPSMLTFSSGSLAMSVFRDGRAIIRGTRDEAVARSLYARYIGL